jgi:hypothetical protein
VLTLRLLSIPVTLPLRQMMLVLIFFDLYVITSTLLVNLMDLRRDLSLS